MGHKAKITAICNQKGGVGKTVTAVSLGIGLAQAGKKVLLVDVDAQGSLTASLGYQHTEQIKDTLADMMGRIILDEPVSPGEGILHQQEGVDLVPANIELSGLEVTLVNTMSRETVLREYLNSVRERYDVILLDCCPSLGMLTINALAAADEVIIPMQAHYLSIKGMEQLIRTISNVKRKINPGLEIAGILITMADMRTNYSDTSAPHEDGPSESDSPEEAPTESGNPAVNAPAPSGGNGSTALSIAGCVGGIASLLAAGYWGYEKFKERKANT